MSLSRRQIITMVGVGATMLALPSTALSTSTKTTGSKLQAQLNWLIKRQRREGRISSNERTAWSQCRQPV